MAWLEAHQSIERHPKTLDLASRMGWDLDVTIAKLFRFWWWCVDYAEDGDLRKHNDGRLGGAVGLNGEAAGKFVQEMVAACWLDRDPYFRVHDWWVYVGPFLRAKYKKKAETWQAIRDKCATKTIVSNELEGNGSGNGSSNRKPTNQPTNHTLDFPETVPETVPPPPPRPPPSGTPPPPEEPDDRVFAAAVKAFDFWAVKERGNPLQDQNNECRKVSDLLHAIEQLPPIVRGSEQIPRPMLVPLAVDILAKSNAEFRSISYACGAVKNALESWSVKGMPGDKGRAPAPPKPQFGKANKVEL